MKKIIMALMAIMLITGTALAVKQINLSNTIMRQADIRINYDESGNATADVIVVYDVCDTDCTFIKQESKQFLWTDLPAQTQTTLSVFLQFVDKEFRAEKIDENDSDMVFKK